MAEGSTVASLTKEDLDVLTVAEIRGIISHRLAIPRSHHSSKALLLEWILARADVGLIETLAAVIQVKLADRLSKREQQKRKNTEQVRSQRKAARVEAIEQRTNHDPNLYLDLPSEDVLHRCYESYIEATSDAAVKLSICAVCARELIPKDDSVSNIALSDIPNT
ncbi:hypothetical protein PHLCEN_2v6066, partial [Hermanssonia centrifuga]